MADDAARRVFIDARMAMPEYTAMIAADMPLRANLSVIENIAVVPQYHRNLGYADAIDEAWNLLLACGHTDAAYKRDPALSHAERFVAKLLRAVASHPAHLLIDRPALLLPDTHYPPYVEDMLNRLDDQLNDCWIVDYTWNAPLYNAPPPAHP